jgi:hypothetical protein
MFDFFKPKSDGAGEAKAAASTPESPKSTQTEKTGLDKYESLWYNDNVKVPAQAPSFDLPSDAVGDLAKSQDFLAGLPQNVMEGLESGDKQAFLHAIEFASRNAYASAMQHLPKVTDAYLKQKSEYDSGLVKTAIRSELTTQELAQEVNYQNPVIRNEMNRIASSLQARHPDASPKEIAEAAKDYMRQLSKAFGNGEVEQSNKGKPSTDTNWDDFFGFDNK